MMVDEPTTSGIAEVPVSPTAELDAQLDEYNAERPRGPCTEFSYLQMKVKLLSRSRLSTGWTFQVFLEAFSGLIHHVYHWI